MFVYDAVRELLLLGDTTIKASELRKAIAELKEGGGTGYQKQFAVSGDLGLYMWGNISEKHCSHTH